MNVETPVFEVRNVTVARRIANGVRRIVDDVSLLERQGEVLALMGENGAGKSTLLKTMSGDVRPDRGEVLLNDRALIAWSALEQARQRAVLPQETTLAFAFTAFEIVLLGRSPWCGGHPGAVDRSVARDALRRTDALHLAPRSYPTLSGGERARVMLARVIAQIMRDEADPEDADGAGLGGPTPRALLLDEPSAMLDIAHQHAAFKTIRDLAHNQGVAVVAVLHDPNLASMYADRVALMKEGRLLACGRTAETMTEDLMSRCFSIAMRRVPHPTRDASLLVAVTE